MAKPKEKIHPRQQILKEAVEDFKKLYYLKYKVKLTDKKATEQAYAMLDGMRALLGS